MKLGKGFINLTEGENQTLKISKVTYDEKYDKCKVTFKDDRGGSCTEQFLFTGKNGKPNEVALNIFTTLAMCALNDFGMQETEFDPQELEDCYVQADVIKDIVTDEDTGRTNTYYHVRNFKVADLNDAEADEEDDEGLFD